jgi:hypothetical protein
VNIYKEIMIDGLYTELGKKIATKFDPKTLIKVVAERRGVEGDPTEHVVFYFEDGIKICIFNSFTTGYRGEGPWGLHDVLVALGLPEEQAKDVFTKKSVHTFYFRTPPPKE